MRSRISKRWKELCGLDVLFITPKIIAWQSSKTSCRQFWMRCFSLCFPQPFLVGICLTCVILCTMCQTQLMNFRGKFWRTSLKQWLTTPFWIICTRRQICWRIHPHSISYSSLISKLILIMLRELLQSIAMSHLVAIIQLQVPMKLTGLHSMGQRNAICRWMVISEWWTKLILSTKVTSLSLPWSTLVVHSQGIL